ncbi:MAG: SMC-Scp complex subunit ScpB [Gammaproteobacteria bacterium]
MSLDDLQKLFDDPGRPDKRALQEALATIAAEYAERGIDLAEVASGWRVQVRPEYSEWLSRLWQERPPKYSRALLETLALVAYRQPITRGEIEDIRGVSVSSNIVRTLQERGWIRVVGHRDVPGKPEMFGTTREFLDYFGLKRLDDLPTLAEIRDLDSINVELDFGPRPDAAGASGALESESGEYAALSASAGTESAPEGQSTAGASVGQESGEHAGAESAASETGTARPATDEAEPTDHAVEQEDAEAEAGKPAITRNA